MKETFADKFRRKAGEVLGHPLVRQASLLGEDILNITASLADNHNPISIGSAVLAGANVLADTFNIELMSPVSHYAKKHEISVVNGELHKLLLSSGAAQDFPCSSVLKYESYQFNRLRIGEKSDVYWLSSTSNETYDLYTDTAKLASQYWTNKDFDIRDVYRFFWCKYPKGINLTYGKTSKGDSSGEDVEISELPAIGPYTDGKNSTVDMAQYLRKSKELGISRSFLLYGCAGGGKTSYVEKVAEYYSHQIVKVDASFLEMVDSSEIEKLLGMLNPEIVLFDDFDRVDFDVHEGKFLYITENLKRKHPTITFFATINNPESMTPALLRPGRFDEKIEFKPPGTTTCLDIVELYCQELNVAFNDEEVLAGLNGCRFTPAECKEAVSRKRLREELSFKKIFADIKRFQSFGGDSEFESDDSDDADKSIDAAAVVAKMKSKIRLKRR